MYTDLDSTQSFYRGTSPRSPALWGPHSPTPPEQEFELHVLDWVWDRVAATLVAIGASPDNASIPAPLHCPSRALWRGCGGRSRPPRWGVWGAAPQAEEVGFDQSRVQSQDLCVQGSPGEGNYKSCSLARWEMARVRANADIHTLIQQRLCFVAFAWEICYATD
ncbi:MAG: hypothetical protein NW220_21980 [Leptolyngbyaceae cyanobacterium bins.349]|nr:hypothetical protein [Leptolyngbyaceae cyanobacterium bins.349]